MNILRRMTAIPFMFVFMVSAHPALAEGGHGLEYVHTADGRQSRHSRDLVQWTHTRLVFKKDLERVAVGQESTIELEVLGSKEILALAKKVGRTSIIVWYTDSTTETFLFSVVQDLSVLRRALRDIHPRISIELAPDRAALVLRGNVPTVKYRMAAESVARNYLEVANKKVVGNADILVQKNRKGGVTSDSNFRFSNADSGAERSAAIINLIQVEHLPLSSEEKLQMAIKDIGGERVTVRRILKGDSRDDGADTLTLTGSVRNQVELTRVLSVVSSMFLGTDATRDPSVGVRALADESGGFLSERTSGSSSKGSLGFAGGATGGAGDNSIRSNIARSPLISVAGGRILSMIEVRDLPQVRVAVQMHEVNRASLRSWRPDVSLTRAGSAVADINKATTVQNALQILGGALTNNLQVAKGRYAFDMLFSLLEEEGISKTLSRPTLTVLAGETAVFRAGGEVPVPRAFAPTGISNGDTVGANTPGVFSGTEFKAFGVELKVRAMVGADDSITLDVNPTVSLPDTLLTQQIAGSTGTALNTAAFNVRSIDTSARLRDGQPLIIGGLVTRDISDNNSFTPGLNSIPLLGKLAESSRKADTGRELVIVVTPTIVRESKHNIALWEFPGSSQLLKKAVPVAMQAQQPKSIQSNYASPQEGYTQ